MNPESKSPEDVQAAQALLDSEGCEHWTVVHVPGTAADVIARFRAERVIPGGRSFGVLHDNASTLLALCREADARFSTAPEGVVVVSGTADTRTQGGSS